MARSHENGDLENSNYESYSYEEVAEGIVQDAIDCLNANDVSDGSALSWVSDYVDITDAVSENSNAEQLQSSIDNVLEK